MGEKDPTEILLEASGVKAVPAQDAKLSPETMKAHLEQVQRSFESLLGDVKTVTGAANRAQEKGELLAGYLDNYCLQKMPVQMKEAFETVAGQVIRSALLPLEDGVRRAVKDVEGLRQVLYKFSWYWLRDIAITGVLMGLVAWALVHWTLTGKLEQMDEARRYEMWGRAVEQRIAQYPPKDQKKLRGWIGSPPAAAGK